MGLRRDRHVWSRLWPLASINRQTKLPKHVGAVPRSVSLVKRETVPLITTDGFGFYEKVVGRVFGRASTAKVIKMRKDYWAFK